MSPLKWLLVMATGFFSDFWIWMDAFAKTYGYVGAFVVSIIGNVTIFFPVPYAIVIYALGMSLDPILLGISCGLGSTIGEFSSYFLGRGGRKLIEKRYGKRLESAKLLVQRFGMLAIFAFAVLPIPDDLIMIPMGMMEYSMKKLFAAMLAGKTILGLTLAYAGRYSFSFIRDLFESGGIMTGIISTVLIILLIVAMLKIDWTRFIPMPEETKKAENETDVNPNEK